MSKYIINREPTLNEQVIFKIGMISLCLYIATTFPGSFLYYNMQIYRYSLYLFVAVSALIVIASIRDGLVLNEHSIWYAIFTTISFFLCLVGKASVYSDGFHSVIICLLLQFFISIYIQSELEFKMVLWTYVISGTLNCIALYRMGYLRIAAGSRLGEAFAVNSNHLATYLMYSFTYAIWILWNENKWSEKILILVQLPLLFYCLALTGGRKYLLGPFVFIIIMLFSYREDNNSSRRVPYMLVGIGVFFLMLVLIRKVPVLYYSVGRRMGRLFSAMFNEAAMTYSDGLRAEMRRLAIEGWLKSPIWGHGFDTFKYYGAENGVGLGYSHCNFTELLYNGGLLYFIGYYYFHIMLLVRSMKLSTNNQKDSKLRSFCISAICMQLFFDFGGVSYSLFQCQTFLLMAYTSALLIPLKES